MSKLITISRLLFLCLGTIIRCEAFVAGPLHGRTKLQARRKDLSVTSGTLPPHSIPGTQHGSVPCELCRPAKGAVALVSWFRSMGTRMKSTNMAAAFLPRLTTVFAVLFLTALLLKFRLRLFWPGVKSDPEFPDHPLPPASLGCPWLGNNILAGSKKKGPEYFYREASKRIGDPRVWMFYFLGSPVVAISDPSLIQKINSMEFKATEALSFTYKEQKGWEEEKDKPAVFGNNNVMFERNEKKHSYLRKLVGSAMMPSALKAAIPTIQETAENTIQTELLQNIDGDGTPVKMEDVCTSYTMDIVQKQLLGLNLSPEENHIFREKLEVWLKGLFSLSGTFGIPWLVKRSAPYKARLYVAAKIEEKIDELLANGPDSSTLSNMLFATDEKNQSRLTREDVVENALLLVIAGSETSASTLTLATFLLGIHPEKYQRLVEEQREVVKKNGPRMRQDVLDNECPWLEATLKEALRMGPVSGNFPKRTLKTITIDGVQIPKGWSIFSAYRLAHQLDPVTRLEDDAHMDPLKGFAPERWLQPETTPSTFFAFGSGPRYCLGVNLAMTEMKIFLASLARAVPSFELNAPIQDGKVLWNPSTLIPRPLDGARISSVERAG